MSKVRGLIITKTKTNYVFSYKNSKVELEGVVSHEAVCEKFKIFSDQKIEEWQFKLTDYTVYLVVKCHSSWIRMIKICDMQAVHKIACAIL